MNLKSIFSFIAKLGGLAVTAFGVQAHSWEDMTVGAAGAAAIHWIDSTWNSVKGEQPQP